MLQGLLAYLLMLAFMTYNIWFCLAVVLGSGLGYFVFAWLRIVVTKDSIGDHCH